MAQSVRSLYVDVVQLKDQIKELEMDMNRVFSSAPNVKQKTIGYQLMFDKKQQLMHELDLLLNTQVEEVNPNAQA